MFGQLYNVFGFKLSVITRESKVKIVYKKVTVS